MKRGRGRSSGHWTALSTLTPVLAARELAYREPRAHPQVARSRQASRRWLLDRANSAQQAAGTAEQLAGAAHDLRTGLPRLVALVGEVILKSGTSAAASASCSCSRSKTARSSGQHTAAPCSCIRPRMTA